MHQEYLKMRIKTVILQSNYLPWKGYFDLINMVDVFVFFDDVQYTPRNWRNRNRIKTPNGLKWLTVPCGESRRRLICDVAITDSQWQKKHWKCIEYFYRRAEYFHLFEPFLKEVYLNKQWEKLSELNQFLIKTIAGHFLKIQTRFEDSRKYSCQEKGLDRVLCILDKIGNVEEYITGPSAKSYINSREKEFSDRGIKLTYMDYSRYPEYKQLFGDFIHQVSIIDLLLNTGPNATKYLNSF